MREPAGSGVVVVTGASRGIGASIACDLAGRGFQVFGLSRSGASAAGMGRACDVTDEEAVRSALAEAASIGPLVGLVNNAGAHSEARSVDLTVSELEASFRINVSAVFAACREAQPHLEAAGGGLIVNIGSFFDRMGVSRSLAYCAGKAAVGAMTRCLAVEWARFGIRVLDVAPGYIETDLNRDALGQPRMQEYINRRVPVRRAGTPDEVARLVGLLFEAEIGFLTGETIYVDGAHGVAHQ